jgi:protocatechuate 3,4-dioxygenase beta subunit
MEFRMRPFSNSESRRRFLQSSAAVAAAACWAPGAGWWARGAFAAELSATPSMMEGPFYPDKLPLDTDNDLLILNDAITPAVGEVTHLTGRILGPDGEPIRNAFVEIWQVDAQGAYLHSQDPQRAKRDSNFQGYGRFMTDSSGQYYFRTIKPVPYPGRTPHIHYAVSAGGKRLLTTQLFVKDHPGNARDGLFQALGDQASEVTTEFAPIPDSKIGELSAKFDVVLGSTPVEDEQGRLRGIGPSEMKSGRAFGGPRGRRSDS